MDDIDIGAAQLIWKQNVILEKLPKAGGSKLH